jgi:RNA polymerase sigma factor (sigma-70 family)
MSVIHDLDDDGHLLRRFATGGEESVFGKLVERHAPLVRGVARRCLGEDGLADEVTQSVFSLLARGAADVPAEHLGGWLHHTTFLTAQNARRAAARYQNALREISSQADVMNATRTPTDSEGSPWEEIRPHLDEAVLCLSERTRRPVMLRFFENRSIHEIAALTGKSEASVRKGIDRALEQLSGFLRRRGITTTRDALGAMLAVHSLLAPPASAAGLAAAALQGTASVTAVTSTTSPAFSTVISKSIVLMTTSQTATITAAAIVLASIPAAYYWRENAKLRQEVQAFKAVTVVDPTPLVVQPPALPKPTAGITSGPSKVDKPAASADPLAVALTALFAPDALLKRAEEDAVKNAVKDMERISLYLPELTDAQKEQVRVALENGNKAKLGQLKTAFESGAFDRVINHLDNATEADRALMAEAAPAGPPSREDDPLVNVLTPDQFETYWQKKEEKRVSDAEESAADALKFLNSGMDLSPEQKDRIFQGLAQVQLAPIEGDEGLSNAFLDQRLREEEKQRVLREHLTPEQVELIEKRLGEFKQGIEKLIETAKGPAGAR